MPDDGLVPASRGLAFSPGGTIVTAASVSGPVVLFDVESGSVLGEAAGHGMGPTSLSWHSSGDLETLREPLGKAAEWSAISRSAWSPRGECVAAGTADGTVRLLRF